MHMEGSMASSARVRRVILAVGFGLAYTYTEDTPGWPVSPFISVAVGGGTWFGPIMNGDAGGLILGPAFGGEVGVVRRLGPAWGLAIGVTAQYVKSDVNGN